MQLDFILNSRPVSIEVTGSETLLMVLRNHFGLLGVKEGCGVGECGACTVLVGRPGGERLPGGRRQGQGPPGDHH